MNHRKRSSARVYLILAAALFLFFGGCKDFSFFSELGLRGGLKVNPSNATITVSTSITFTATGGNPPYLYEIVSGSGTIDPGTGVYDAPASATSAVIMATDSIGESGTANVSVVTSLAALELSPTSASISAGNSISFVATGGVSPYTFSIQTNNSGGNITPGGAYTAGPTTGVSDTIIVTDSDSPPQVCATPATVNVTAAVTNVDYSITANSFTASALAGTALSGGFTISNGGTATGTASISWWLFISEDGTFGGNGEHLVANGSVGTDIPPSGSEVVTPSGNWPSDLPAGNYDLFVMISSPDDLSHGNNTSAAIPFTLSYPDVDYRVLSIANSSAAHVGDPLTGSFDLDNEGTDDGTQAISWKAYFSANTTIDVGDTLFDSGTEGAMTSAEAPRTIPLDGTWPSPPGNYYLVVEVRSADDEAAGNDGDNVTASGSSYSVHYPDVDYEVPAVSHLSGTQAGGSVDGEFSLDNIGSDDGSSTVNWWVYASVNTTIDAGDALIASGTDTAMALAEPVRTIPFTGTWPVDPGWYYLLVKVSAADEVLAGNMGNNETATAAPVDVTVANVDYYADAVAALPGVAGGPITVDFQLSNLGSDASVSAVTWNLYVSTNNTLDPGDYLADTGTAGPLGAAPASAMISPISALWPAAPGSYYLIVEIESSEDEAAGNEANNVYASGTYPVSAPAVDYRVTQVTHTGGGEKVPGQPFTGEFRYANNGALAMNDGAGTVSWTCYASTDLSLDPEDAAVASGGGLPAMGLGATSSTINFSGNWPLDYGEYYLIVKVASSDSEQDTSNDWLATGGTIEVGVYTEVEPNNEYTALWFPGAGYNILWGANTTTPIVLEPGMSIKIIGTDIEGTPPEDNDTFLFNAGTANSITITLLWSTGTDCLDIILYEEGDPAGVLKWISGLPDEMSATFVRGAGPDQYSMNQMLWLNVYYNLISGNTSYTVIVTAN